MRNPRSRTGRLNTLWGLVLASAALAVALIAMLALWQPQRGGNAKRLKMHCAAGIIVPVEKIAREYEQEYGVKVEIQYGGSGELLNQIEINKFDDADLYLAADDFYTDLAQEKGLAAEVLPVAHQRPVIAVAKDNPKNITKLADLLRDDVRVVIGNPDGPAIGRTTKTLLENVPVGDSNFWVKLEQAVTNRGVFKPTVNDVARDIRVGSLDAGIVWDSTVAMPKFRDHLMSIPADELDAGEPSLVSVSILTSSQQPTSALKFARYVTARDRGLPHFKEFGFLPIDGDVWAERPQLNFFCGAVNRRAVESVIDKFPAREGVEVNASYNGCGFLTAQMSEIKDQNTDLGFPDVYMACDVYYLENVKEWFHEPEFVSDVEIVIAVPKGSQKVTQLEDLVKPDVRVAVGEPNQCTIGALTRRLLQREGLYEKLMAKEEGTSEVVVVMKGSSAHLVPDVVTGNVDAALAYITDVLANEDDVDIIRIDSPDNMAIQPFTIAQTSKFKHLGQRLFDQIRKSPEAFEDVGFHFRLDEQGPEDPAGDSSGETGEGS
jgi:molybdenum ABC transporter molybdate-binding protein